MMLQLKEHGVGIVFVTHFLEQVYAVCDRITVLRNGALVGEYPVAELPRVKLVAAMMGKDFDDLASIKPEGFTYDAEAPLEIEAKGLSHKGMGMYIQSVGINKKASRIAGLNSKRIIFVCYLLCGLCAGIAGIVASSRITSADSNNIGLDMELDAILAVALGGNSLGGGKFNLAGSIIGAYTIQAITTTMYNMGVPSAVTPVFKAVVVIVIVAVQAPPVKAWFKKRSAAKALAKKEVASA